MDCQDTLSRVTHQHGAEIISNIKIGLETAYDVTYWVA